MKLKRLDTRIKMINEGVLLILPHLVRFNDYSSRYYIYDKPTVGKDGWYLCTNPIKECWHEVNNVVYKARNQDHEIEYFNYCLGLLNASEYDINTINTLKILLSTNLITSKQRLILEHYNNVCELRKDKRDGLKMRKRLKQWLCERDKNI